MKKDFLHYWKIRIFVAVVLLAVAFFGVMLNEVSSENVWSYWKGASLFFSVTCMSLNAFLRRREDVSFLSCFFHDVLHWLGFLFAVFLLSLMVDAGVLSSYLSSLVLLLMLALTCYFAGIYQDVTFIFVGLCLVCIATLLCFATMYLYPMIVIVSSLAIILLFVFIHKKRK